MAPPRINLGELSLQVSQRKVRRAQKLKKILRSKSVSKGGGSICFDGGEPEPAIEHQTAFSRDEGPNKVHEHIREQKCSSDDGSLLTDEGDAFAKDVHGSMRQQPMSLESFEVSSPQCHKCDDFDIVKTKYKKQKAMLIQSMECSKQYQNKLKLNEEELKSVQEECERKICSV